MLVRLKNSEYEKLNWDLFKNLVRIRVPGDGSCLFHSLAKSFYKPYIRGNIDGKYFDRNRFVKQLRKDLADKLGKKVDPSNPESPTYYETVSNGELPEIAKSLPAYSLENLQKELNSDNPVDNIYNEFISNELNKDIYILDYTKQDIYMTGTDLNLLYKNRKSIVLLYLPGHYELVGVEENGKIKTLFDPDHELIKTIQKRIISK